MDERRTAAGERIYLSREAERGSKDPFIVAYADPSAEDRWGYFCTHCESAATAMDTMGRIKCNRCANVKKPEEWDAAHE